MLKSGIELTVYYFLPLTTTSNWLSLAKHAYAPAFILFFECHSLTVQANLLPSDEEEKEYRQTARMAILGTQCISSANLC